MVFPEENRSIVGEILNIDNNQIYILLVGEIRNDIFTSGVIKKPSFKSGCRLIYKSELELILGSQDIAAKNTLYLGKSNIYEGYNVSANLTSFFSNHFAIIGNTGCGKSCGVARILQNIFLHNNEAVPSNAHMVIFDVYGDEITSIELCVINNKFEIVEQEDIMQTVLTARQPVIEAEEITEAIEQPAKQKGFVKLKNIKNIEEKA